jgi:hypothetical protein
MVVIAEDGYHRHRNRPARVGEDDGLFRQPVRGQVTGKKHEVALAGESRKRPCEALAQRLGRVDVARGRNT